MKNLKFNIYEIIVGIIGILLLGALVFTLRYTTVPTPETRRVNVSISATSDINSIRELAKTQKVVYIGNNTQPVDLVSVQDGTNFIITLSGPGKIVDGAYYFNGQRVLVGQKTEIHSTYFAQGLITSVSYAN
jgi:hypothetical protein